MLGGAAAADRGTCYGTSDRVDFPLATERSADGLRATSRSAEMALAHVSSAQAQVGEREMDGATRDGRQIRVNEAEDRRR